MSRAIRRVTDGLVVSLPLLAALIAWQYAGDRSSSVSFFFATPSAVAGAAADMLKQDVAWLAAYLDTGIRPAPPEHGLLWNAAITAYEAVAGFLLGNILGATIGISLWYTRTGAHIARPYLVALGALPVFAIAPMTILWFGIGIGAKVMLATLATIFLAAAQAFRGAEQVDPLLLARFRTFGASRALIFRRLLLPSALTWIVASLRLSVGAALLGAFVGEFIAAEHGLGHVIVKASGLYETPTVLVGVCAMLTIALTLDAAVSLVERGLLRRQGGGMHERQ